MLPDAKLHKHRLDDNPHIYFRRLLKLCKFKTYRAAAKALGVTKRTITQYANRGGYSYATQFYLETRAAMQQELDRIKGAIFSPPSEG